MRAGSLKLFLRRYQKKGGVGVHKVDKKNPALSAAELQVDTPLRKESENLRPVLRQVVMHPWRNVGSDLKELSEHDPIGAV